MGSMYIHGLTGLDMKEIGLRIDLMVMENLLTLMVTFMMGNGIKVERKVKAFISTKMVRVIKVIGRMIFSMVLVLKLGVMVPFIKAYIL